MATEKERELMREIIDLALDVTLSDAPISIGAHYIGHIHAFEIDVHKESPLERLNECAEWVNLSAKDDIWSEKQSIEGLKLLLTQVKKHHKDYDADGIRLEVAK